MCLYPCIALLVAIVADRVAESAGNEPWRNVWTVFVRGCAVAIAGAGLAALTVTLAGFHTWLKQPLGWTGPYALLAVAVGALAWWLPARQTGLRCRTAVLAIAGFVPLSYDTLLINAFQGTSVDTAGAVARLEAQLPPGTKLVSFGQIQHLFAFYYRDKIPVLPWPDAGDPLDETIRYFCVEPGQLDRTPLPFRYERIADINCDRHRLEHVEARVIICHRLDPPDSRESRYGYFNSRIAPREAGCRPAAGSRSHAPAWERSTDALRRVARSHSSSFGALRQRFEIRMMTVADSAEPEWTTANALGV